jgi:hypothetical protein
MRALVRRAVAAVVVVHGVIHLLGAAQGFGWVEVETLSDPIGAGWGVVWLAAGVAMIVSGAQLAVARPLWWRWGAVAVVVSQVAIVSSWNDAGAGTIANVVVAVAVVHGHRCEGRRSLRATYQRLVAEHAVHPAPAPVVSEADLVRLPVVLAHYLRNCGAVGRARVVGFRVRLHGRIRSSPGASWMPFTGEQFTVVGLDPVRLFSLDATMGGLPVDVLHTFVGPEARMQVRLLGVVPVVDVTGPEMARSETVTMFNDVCVMAPAALVDEHVVWREIDGHRVEGTYSNGVEAVTAVLVFDDEGDLVDFVSDDRSRAQSDGTTFVRTRWSTPLTAYREFAGRRSSTEGQGRWHLADGTFTYLEIVIDDIAEVTAPVAPSAD